LFCSATVACGSAIDASIFDTDASTHDASSTTDTGATDTSTVTDTSGGSDTTTDTGDASIPDVVTPIDLGAPDVAPDLGLTVDSLCDNYAAGICTGAQSDCCMKDGYSYSQSDCVSAMSGYCNQQLTNAMSNGGTADLSKFGDCMDAMHSLQTACDVSLLTLLKRIPPCELLFTGGQPPGNGCGADSDCAAAPGAAAICDTSSGQCTQIAIVNKGDDCNYSGTQRQICDVGLTCVSKGASGKQTCDTATPLGGDCPGGDGDISCGFGYVCGPSNQCQLGAVAGASCDTNFDCGSWQCGSMGTCTSPSYSQAFAGVCSAKM
jgi:hypothetical protein